MLSFKDCQFNPALLKYWMEALRSAERSRRAYLFTQTANIRYDDTDKLWETLQEISKALPKGAITLTGGESVVTGDGLVAREPARLTVTMESYTFTVIAPHVDEKGNAWLGGLDFHVHTANLKPNMAEGARFKVRFNQDGVSRHPRLFVTDTVDALDTDDLDALKRLEGLVNTLRTHAALLGVLKIIKELTDACYHDNDEKPKDYARLNVLLNSSES